MAKATAKVPLKTVSVSEEAYREHEDNYDGICLGCGQWSCGGVEPDAREYTCCECDLPLVYGASEAMMMGNLDIGDEE